MQWGYRANTSNGECLVEWAANNNLMMLHNPKGAASFTFGCWSTGTNLDLAFVSTRPDNRLPDRCVLEKFPRSQHRPSLFTAAKLVVPALSEPVKLRNFRKADRNYYSLLINEAMQSSHCLAPPILRFIKLLQCRNKSDQKIHPMQSQKQLHTMLG